MGKSRLFLFLTVLTLPLLLAAYAQPLEQSLRVSFFSVTKPFFSFTENARFLMEESVVNTRKFFGILKENERLRKKVAAFNSLEIQSEELEKENRRLRSLLEFKKKLHKEAVASRVIARDVTRQGHWALLDKGYRDGVRKEMPIVNEQGLIGKVVEVGPTTARMILLTDVEARVSGRLQETRDTGLIMGNGGPLLEIKFIDLQSEAKVGDIVMTSGLGDIYPAGIPIGEIHSLRIDRKGLYLKAIVRPFVLFPKMEEVLCIDYPQTE